jgi:hypothetical protein
MRAADLEVGRAYRLLTPGALRGRRGVCTDRRENSFGRVWGTLRLSDGGERDVRASDCAPTGGGSSSARVPAEGGPDAK